MDLDKLYGGSFIDWDAVSASWNKRTVSSRLLLFAYAAPPPAEGESARLWGAFLDAAVAAELEMVSYGERPPLLHELRAGLSQAAEETGSRTERGRWFRARHDALPGTDLPDSPDYLPI
jgi:hypothetical protein